MKPPEWLTITEASKLVSVGYKVVYRIIKENEVKAKKTTKYGKHAHHSGFWIIETSSLLKWKETSQAYNRYNKCFVRTAERSTAIRDEHANECKTTALDYPPEPSFTPDHGPFTPCDCYRTGVFVSLP
jgi:excisionase family DNA binding protein